MHVGGWVWVAGCRARCAVLHAAAAAEQGHRGNAYPRARHFSSAALLPAEQYQQADYSGYAQLECATLVLRTAADPPPASLALSLTLGSAVDELTAVTAPSMKPGTSGDTSLTAAAGRRRLQQWAAGNRGGGSCGIGPVLRVTPEAGRPAAFVVWRDNLNQTFAAGPDAFAARLPPPAALEQTAGGQACSAGSCLALARRYSVHVLAEDGGHAAAYFSFVPGSGQLRVLHKSYGQQQLRISEETLDLGLGGDPWAGCGAAVGSAASGSGGGGGAGGGSSLGVVIGAAVGGAVAAAAAAAGFAWWWRRRRAARHVEQLLVADVGPAHDAAAV